ncbi:hypothetical protein [Lichenicoccus sp.]|uniref:hypothetical protein n=1 Tax=Lichenicoccus sp. TaxID=2781899 RepID=UPI003D0F2A62
MSSWQLDGGLVSRDRAGMNLADGVNRADNWILDRVFQPMADRLGEKPTAFEIGMSMQLGAIVLDAAAVIAIFMVGGLSIDSALWNGLMWALGFAFYLSINRMRPLVRPGHANPLRFMLQGFRPLSIPFLLYSAVQAALAHPPFQMAMQFNALANLVFVIGLYMVSTQPKPPRQRQTVRSGWRQEAGSGF